MDLRIIFSVLPIFITIGMILFGIFGIPIIWHDEIKQMNEERVQIHKENLERLVLVKTSKDCKVLQDEMLSLISNGADSDNWFPNIYDKTLKIAKERSDILC